MNEDIIKYLLNKIRHTPIIPALVVMAVLGAGCSNPQERAVKKEVMNVYSDWVIHLNATLNAQDINTEKIKWMQKNKAHFEVPANFRRC